LAYVSDDLFDDYIHDMKLTQSFADLNRRAMMQIILEELKIDILSRFATVHNYIDTETMILRKGAVSAQKGETLIMPMNMRDGSLICVGKGNEDWNFSAPHGAGRRMSRTVAKQRLTLEDYKRSMEGIYSTSVNSQTLDEAPMAYKAMDDITRHMEDTVDVAARLRPIYNFKAPELKIF
jgi:RNA-splicing ligase RtcB